jgi:hypothetical protein
MTDIKPITAEDIATSFDDKITITETEVPIESVVDNLEVSEPATENEKELEKPIEAVTKNLEEQEKVMNDDGDSSSSSDDDVEVSKELGLVISALQSTVKQNQEKELAHIEEKKEEEGQGEAVEEEELHSGDDNESDTKSSAGDDNSVTTSTSTNVSQEEEKVVIEETTAIATSEEVEENTITTAIPQTFEEIVQDILPPTPGVAPQRQTFDFGGRPSEDVGDVESYSANLIALNKIDTKEIKANLLSPRQQERAGKIWYRNINIGSCINFSGCIDEPVLRAIRHLFNNRFMKAKKLFEKEAET